MHLSLREQRLKLGDIVPDIKRRSHHLREQKAKRDPDDPLGDPGLGGRF